MDDLKTLLEKALEAVRIDINHIFVNSMKGKLKPNEAKDLVAYTKVLADAVEQQKKDSEQEEDELAKLTDEDLRKRAKAVLKNKGS